MNFIELFQNIQGVQAVTSTVGFNACHYAGADMQQVENDRAILANYFNVEVGDLFIPVQTHTANVGMPGEDLQGVDGMVTNKVGQVIAVNTADCLPLLLADVDAKVIAAVHCGWRGTVAGVAQNAVREMIKLGANPANIKAVMGPCILTECFEVGEEVASQFPDEAVVRTYPRPHVDLAKTVEMQLAELGVNTNNIEKPLACSVCDTRFHSVRREGLSLPYRTITAIKLV